MGEVYRDIHQEPIRLEARDGDHIVGICQAIAVPARRGRHLSVPYGPVVAKPEALGPMVEELKKIAREKNCAFMRMSPFWPEAESRGSPLPEATPSPLHLLAEHVWYVPLKNPDPWAFPSLRQTALSPTPPPPPPPRAGGGGGGGGGPFTPRVRRVPLKKYSNKCALLLEI